MKQGGTYQTVKLMKDIQANRIILLEPCHRHPLCLVDELLVVRLGDVNRDAICTLRRLG